MLRVKFFSTVLFFSLAFNAQGQVPTSPNGSATPVKISNNVDSPIIKKETFQFQDFEIVVSSYENNGVKTVIVTRNKNGVFYDRTEWVGKGELPDEVKSLMGKAESFGGQNLDKSYFGVIVVNSRRESGGVNVTEVVGKSPAFKSGLKKGDLITSLNGKKIRTAEDLAKILTKVQPGEKAVCRFFRGDRLNIEKIELAEVPKATGLNLNAIDGGKVLAPVATNSVSRSPGSTMPKATGGKDIRALVNNLPLTNYTAFITPNNNWINLTFNAPAAPISAIVFDKEGKEVFHQHLTWFQGNYKQLIKIKPGVEGPFQIIVAQGGNVFSQTLKTAE